eukprot:CAMPEP_0181493006 /NCGR_PEP_ID=MMETSP1110-20121109/50992_1 /TAXON_ID=174948 /ORGANISM="Symbiodinium sp., Strain CCMP421" /LENGTH=155 /DNA_ID=CAMNT_0023620291 /DNA_START=36 /DNA_END=500 /DNA_ORIENTATION=+
MTTQAKNSLRFPPHQWLDIQKSSLVKERQTQRANFRRAHPNLTAKVPPGFQEPDKTFVLPSEVFRATWTASLSKVGTLQGSSCWRQTPAQGPAPHLIPPRPLLQCNSKGEIYQLGPVKESQGLPRVRTAPDLKAGKVVTWPGLPSGDPPCAGIPM